MTNKAQKKLKFKDSFILGLKIASLIQLVLLILRFFCLQDCSGFKCLDCSFDVFFFMVFSYAFEPLVLLAMAPGSWIAPAVVINTLIMALILGAIIHLAKKYG